MKMSIAADTEDYNLWSSDFKQVELRILPFVAGQQDLINIESDMDVDAHRAILSILTKSLCGQYQQEKGEMVSPLTLVSCI